MTPQTFIFFGTSGSGKGTQALLLKEFLEKNDSKKVLYLETGEKMRDLSKKDNLTGRKTKEILDAGGLMPEFLPVLVWAEFFVENVNGDEHIILDGVSRREHEAVIIDSVMKFYDRQNPTVIFLEVSPEWATDKMEKRGRVDDRQEEIKNRLAWYEKNVLPAINHFRNNPYYRFISINGEQSIEEVHQEILNKAGL